MDGAEAPILCEGSAEFDIAARQATQVAVRLSCRLPKRSGSIVVSGEFNVCPALDALSVLPSEVEVGSSIALVATASDADHALELLSYAWSADGGELDTAWDLTTLLPAVGPNQGLEGITWSRIATLSPRG